MSLYRYRGRDSTGKRCRGVIEAKSPKEARLLLEGQGILTEQLGESKAKGDFGDLERSQLYRELGVMLTAGFTLEQALGMMGGGEGGGKSQALALALRQGIEEGDALSQALRRVVRNVPSFEQSTLLAAEESGMQGEMLVQLADFMEEQQRVYRKLKASMLYPLFVFALALGLLSLMMLVVLPRAARMFGEFGDGVPGMVGLVTVWGPRVMVGMLLLLGVVATAALLIWRRAGVDREVAIRCELILLRVRVARNIAVPLWGMRFARTMGLLMRAGSAPQELLEVAGRATGSEWIGVMSGEQAQKVREGESLSRAIGAIEPLAVGLEAWVRVGESSGALADMLEQAAGRYQNQYEESLGRVIGIMEPALIVGVGAVVLLVAYTVLKPMLELVRAAGGQ